MKPTLYIYQSKLGSEATLVDEDSAFLFEDEQGKTQIHYATAIDIGRIKAGLLVIKNNGNDRTVLEYPRPCVLEKHKDMKKADPLARGIAPKAAVLLLNIANSANNVKIKCAKKTWDMDYPAILDVEVGWDAWKFIAAWKWSSWESRKVSGAYRHQVMKDLGYPKSYATMRKMMADLGLVTRRRSSQ
jgi:hypothetical protein